MLPLPVILYVTSSTRSDGHRIKISHAGQVSKMYVAAIEALAQTVDAKDQLPTITWARSERIGAPRTRAGLEDEGDIQAIKAAALLHDIGKLAIPEHILNNPGRLTPAEFEIMKRHAPIGADICVIDFPYAFPDRSASPRELGRHGLSRQARRDPSRSARGILSVVDCFDRLPPSAVRPRSRRTRCRSSPIAAGPCTIPGVVTRSSRSRVGRTPSGPALADVVAAQTDAPPDQARPPWTGWIQSVFRAGQGAERPNLRGDGRAV